MITKALKNIALYEIRDTATQTTYYGCDQEWYRSKWKRLSGCGPTAFSNIISYFNRTRNGEKTTIPLSKEDAVLLMEDVWQHVTPTLRGIPSTEIFCNGVRSYGQAKGLPLEITAVDLPRSRLQRPSFSELLRFLAGALESDTPVAFLNLDNGDEKRLDSWHWVTVVALEYAEDGSAASVEVLDAGKVQRLDLALWFHTTSLGGGFVRTDFGTPEISK